MIRTRSKRHFDSDEEEYSDEDDWYSEDDRYPPLKRNNTDQKEELKKKIQSSQLPPKAKAEALNKLDFLNSDKEKTLEWIQRLMSIPFGKKLQLPVTKKSNREDINKFFEGVDTKLDAAVYGMKQVKEEVVNYIAQMISTNNNTKPRVLGLQGSPGVGKTALVRGGFAQALGRPMQSISMGGIRDSNYFLGHDFTYVGSQCGIIIQSLIQLKCMNGILFMDEVDKVPLTHDGREIQNLLIHLTDPVQNHEFHDKYFAGIDFDLSQMIFVFSFNDDTLIDPILRDRLHIIKVPDPTVDEKIVIGRDYLLTEIRKNVGFRKNEIIIADEVIKHIVTQYCSDQKGVRGLKKCLESLLLKLNTARFQSPSKCKYKTIISRDKSNTLRPKVPFTITHDVVKELLQQKEKDPDWMHSLYL
jgi:ATP-dependent Lon protease